MSVPAPKPNYRGMWIQSLQEARKDLGITGFQLAPKGSELYDRAKAIMDDLKANGKRTHASQMRDPKVPRRPIRVKVESQDPQATEFEDSESLPPPTHTTPTLKVKKSKSRNEESGLVDVKVVKTKPKSKPKVKAAKSSMSKSKASKSSSKSKSKSSKSK